VSSESEEFQKLVAPGGVLIRIFEVVWGLQGVRVRGRGVDVSRLNDSNKLIWIRPITLQVLLMRNEPQGYLITKATRTQCILGLLN